MKRVLIIEAQIKRYRKPFYERLYAALREEGVHLGVVYCAPAPSEAQKQDNCELPREYGVKVRAFWFARGHLLFQPALREALAADLVVIEQANKFILNHLLLILSFCQLKKVAFWGLGKTCRRTALLSRNGTKSELLIGCIGGLLTPRARRATCNSTACRRQKLPQCKTPSTPCAFNRVCEE